MGSIDVVPPSKPSSGTEPEEADQIAQLAAVAERLSHPVVVATPGGDIIVANDAAGRLFGRSASQLVGESLLDRRASFLLEAQAILATASDYADTLHRLAAVAVPELGDLCLIDVRESGGEIRRIAAVHADPSKNELVSDLCGLAPLPGSAHPSTEVMATGRSLWSPTMPDKFLRQTTRDRRHFELAKALDVMSYMCVPLLDGGEVLGVITVLSAGSGRRFQARDVAVLEELASRMASVIASARRHTRQRQLAHDLQQILLPTELPNFPQLEVAVRYMSSSEESEAGGDFYDLVRLPSGRAGLLIGDIEGHDARAAAVMGQMRSASRALSGQVREPAALVDALRWSWELLGYERIATALFARIEPRAGEVVLSSAGHLPPVLLDVTGRATLVSVKPSPPLGCPGPAAVDIELILGAGDLLFFFTDGLVERRERGMDEGLATLLSVLERAHASSPDAICEEVLAEFCLPGVSEDDVAIIAVRRVAPEA